jgi:N-acyl-phosphatidylethanolamine-hydrolysing phospholipase D
MPFARALAVSGLLLAGCATARHEPAVRGLPLDDPAGASFSAVWVGHATVLMRFGRRTVLADPNLGGAILLYPRLTPPSVTARELPPIDLVLLSHMHADHFDARTVRELGRRPLVLSPAGGEPYVTSLRQRHRALQHWESTTVRGVTITAVPVAHAGGRYGLDSFWNHAYTGFVLEAGGRSVFFAGDTGYDPKMFRAIAARYPHLDVAFIPIGPARGGNKNHASPKEALDIFADVGAHYMVPIHFEAYYSAAVPYEEPRQMLEDEVARRGLGARVYALRTGERLVLPDAPGAPPWISDEVRSAKSR